MLLRTSAVRAPLSFEVQQAAIAYDNSIVLLAYERQKRHEAGWKTEMFDHLASTILHYGSNSKYKHEFPLEETVRWFKMLSPQEVVFLLPNQGKAIVFINLRRRTVQRKTHIYLPCSQENIFVFPESNLFCLQESSSTIFSIMILQKQSRLTYFDSSLPQKPVVCQYVYNNQTNKQKNIAYYIASQGNRQSLVALCKRGQPSEKDGILLHDLQLQGRKYLSRERYIHCSHIQQTPVQVWEFKQDQFMIVPLHSKEFLEVWIYNYKENSFRSFFCQTHPNTILRALFLKQFVCIIEGDNNLLTAKKRPDTLHFVGYQSQKGEFVSKQQDLLNRKYAVSCLDSSVLVETVFDIDKGTVEVNEWKTVRRIDISLHLLLHLNEDFDDDLLSDALDLLL